jgi:hypothetical protein
VESRLKYLEQALGDSEAKHREETGTIWDHSCWQKIMDVDVMNVMEFMDGSLRCYALLSFIFGIHRTTCTHAPTSTRFGASVRESVHCNI